MKVSLPNEAHLLAAVHLASGGLHITTNFDDGIEHAYALLSGDAELPSDAAQGFHRALDGWRHRWPDAAPPLRAIWRSRELDAARLRRPSLVKLHGSLGRDPDGLTLSMPPMTDEPDPGDLGTGRGHALDALAAEDFVVVTGFSAADLATRTALLKRLTPGRFWWMTAEIDAEVRHAIAAIDPGQPMIGQPLEAFRAIVTADAPAWPRVRAPGPSFDDRLEQWAAKLPSDVAAEALAWALSDAGRVDEAVEILRRLVQDGAGARTKVRLADAVSRRRWPGDVRSARRTFLRAASTHHDRRSGPAVGLRSYALARWFESVGTGSDIAPPILVRLLALPALVFAVAVGAVAASGRHPTRSTRAATVACGTVLSALERDLPTILETPVLLRPVRGLTATATTAARHVLDRWAHAPSGRRRAMLERQVVELETIGALLRGAAPPTSASPSLRHLSAVFRHVSDRKGWADTAGTQALVRIAMGDIEGAITALDEATLLRPEPVGVIGLVRILLGIAHRDGRTWDGWATIANRGERL
jgi:hypothetical protein